MTDIAKTQQLCTELRTSGERKINFTNRFGNKFETKTTENFRNYLIQIKGGGGNNTFEILSLKILTLTL